MTAAAVSSVSIRESLGEGRQEGKTVVYYAIFDTMQALYEAAELLQVTDSAHVCCTSREGVHSCFYCGC